MPKRPISITIIAWVFIAVGCTTLIAGFLRLGDASQAPRPGELAVASASRILAIVAGAFMLRGCNWARWLLVLWLAYHIYVGALHSTFQVAVHSLLFLVVTYLLFRPPASVYFRQKGST